MLSDSHTPSAKSFLLKASQLPLRNGRAIDQKHSSAEDRLGCWVIRSRLPISFLKSFERGVGVGYIFKMGNRTEFFNRHLKCAEVTGYRTCENCSLQQMKSLRFCRCDFCFFSRRENVTLMSAVNELAPLSGFVLPRPTALEGYSEWHFTLFRGSAWCSGSGCRASCRHRRG